MSYVPIEHFLTWGDFLDDTGLSADDVISSIMCVVPLPVYPLPRPRPAAKPEMLWHPMLWLPEHITRRRSEHEERDDDLYALRVALETATVGLWDVGTGTWLDVLSTVGLDIDRAEDLRRAKEWLEGEADNLIESIDISDLCLYEDNPDWATQIAYDLLPVAFEVVWSTGAATQILAVRQTMDSIGDTRTVEEACEWLQQIAGISAIWLRRCPEIDELPVPEKSPAKACRAIEAQLAEGPYPIELLEADIAPRLIAILWSVRETYQPSVDELNAVLASETTMQT